MTTPLHMDKRFKVTPEDVADMRIMRSEGVSYRRIAQKHSIAVATAMYWTNESYRAKQRKKNAKRISDNKKRVALRLDKDSKFTKEMALGYIAKRVYGARCKKSNEFIFGLPWSYWDSYLESNWKRGGRKIE